jgi:hypothetical protein
MCLSVAEHQGAIGAALEKLYKHLSIFSVTYNITADVPFRRR